MSAELILVVVGFVIQLAGAVIAFHGLSVAVTEEDPAESLARPIRQRWRSGWWSLWVRFRYLIGRPIPVNFTTGTAVETSTAGNAHLTVGLTPLSPDLAPEDAIAALDAALRKLHLEVQTLGHRLSDEVESRSNAIAAMSDQLERTVATAGDEQRRRTIRGLRREAWGFILITLGAILQGLGSVFGAWPATW